MLDYIKPVKISRCRLINCQSLGNVEFEFSEGLNIITAPNNTGKSVYFKMLKVAGCPTFYTRKELGELIAFGADHAMAVYLFSDNSCAAVKVYRNGPQYYFTEEFNVHPFTVSRTPDPRMVRNLSLIVDPEESYIANILDLDQSLLLVNSNTKANHNLVKLLTSNETLNHLIATTAEKSKLQGENMHVLDDIVLSLEHQLKSYQYVDTDRLAQRIVNMGAGIDTYQNLLDAYRGMQQVDYSVFDNKNYDNLLWLLDFVEEGRLFCEGSEYLFSENNEGELLQVLDIYAEMQDSMDGISRMLPDLSLELECSLELVDLCAAFLEAEVVKSDVGSILTMLDIYEELIPVHVEFEKANTNLQSVKELDVDLSEIRNFINSVGKRVPCVIYGEVQHIDGQCIPYSN
jgi:hypothetical protein